MTLRFYFVTTVTSADGHDLHLHVTFDDDNGAISINGVRHRDEEGKSVMIGAMMRDQIWSNWIAEGCPRRETA
jgi:hypothetical protein